jgi:TPP-dependent pyruvate/acetoin dehydrogenase alpha subunit
MLTVNDLAAFSEKVAAAFLAKRIKAPIHLSGGNEEQLINIFKDITPQDWVFSTWRSSYHALLKGISEEWVMKEILAGRSMYLINKEYNFYSSSIVGGTLPIAAGVAMGMKMNQSQSYELQDRVYVFLGDMTAYTGIYHEFYNYCIGHDLPVRIIVEDNGMSTNTPTEQVWGRWNQLASIARPNITKRYKYQRKYPHVGIGQHVQF